MWDDHDPDIHGRYSDFEDDPEYSTAFTWSCCDKEGDDEGCKSTKHKANVNIIVLKSGGSASTSSKEESLRRDSQTILCSMRELQLEV